MTFEDAEDIITDSLLEPIESRYSLILAECEEKQKEQAAKLQATFDLKLARLRAENEKLNAEKNFLREQNGEIKRLKKDLTNAAEAKNVTKDNHKNILPHNGSK